MKTKINNKLLNKELCHICGGGIIAQCLACGEIFFYDPPYTPPHQCYNPDIACTECNSKFVLINGQWRCPICIPWP